MNDSFLVCFLQSLGDFGGNPKGLPEGNPAFSKALLQCLALHVLHDDKVSVFDFTDLMDVTDVRMIKGRSGFSFSDETSLRYCILLQVLGQELEGDPSIETCIFGEVDFSHSTFADFLQYPVMADCLPNHGNRCSAGFIGTGERDSGKACSTTVSVVTLKLAAKSQAKMHVLPTPLAFAE